MERPDEVHLSRAEGEALRTRLASDVLTAADRRVLDQVLQWYFWLLFALQLTFRTLFRSSKAILAEPPEERRGRVLHGQLPTF